MEKDKQSKFYISSKKNFEVYNVKVWGRRNESEEEGSVKEIEPEPDPKEALNKQPTLPTQCPSHKNPTPQSSPQSTITTPTKTPPNRPMLTPPQPKYTKVEVNHVVASVATTSAEQVNDTATAAVAKKIQRQELNKGGQVLLSNSKLKVLPEKIKSKQSGPFKLVRVYPNGTMELFDEATSSTFKVNGKMVKQYYGAHVVRDKVTTELPEL